MFLWRLSLHSAPSSLLPPSPGLRPGHPQTQQFLFLNSPQLHFFPSLNLASVQATNALYCVIPRQVSQPPSLPGPAEAAGRGSVCRERERACVSVLGETLEKGYAASLPTPRFTANSGSSLLSDSTLSPCSPFPRLPREVQESSLFLLVTLGEGVL